jgi:hypothetical protein
MVDPQFDMFVRRYFGCATRGGTMGHCPSCGDRIREVVESDSDATVWECESYGAVLGVTKIGV